MSVGRIVIDRAGRVFLMVDGRSRRMGWVDKDRPVSSRAPWRGVREGGQERSGFWTRADAAAWVVAA